MQGSMRIWFIVNMTLSVGLTLRFLYFNNARVGKTFVSTSAESQLNKSKSTKLSFRLSHLSKASSRVTFLKFNKTKTKNITPRKWILIRQNTFCLSAEAPGPGERSIKDRTYVRLQRCNPDDPLQHFRYNKKTKQIVAKLKNNVGGTMCLDVHSATKSFGEVQMYTCHKPKNQSPNQKWDMGVMTGKHRYRIVSNTKLCLTSRNKEAFTAGAWKNHFQNMPQQFKDHHKTDGGDFVAVRSCSKGYNFFYTRMQRWRRTSPTVVSFDASKGNQITRISSHDGVTLLLTVPRMEASEEITQELALTYPGIHIIILSGGEVSQSDASNFHENIISFKEVLEDKTALLSLIKTKYILVMGASNQLMPDFDLYSLVETLEADPDILAAAGYLQDDKTLYRACYTAMKPSSIAEANSLKTMEREVHLLDTSDFYSVISLAGTKSLKRAVKEKQIRYPKEIKLYKNDSTDEEARKVWVDGYFYVSSKSATMLCDRSSKPVLVKKNNLMHVIKQDLSSYESSESMKSWKPKELIDGKIIDGKMRRIAVNPEFRSRTTAYSCTKDPKDYIPNSDCYLPPDDMEIPLMLDEAWSPSSPCRKVTGADEKRELARKFSQALEHFGRYVFDMPFYYMDGALLGMAKLGTFSPWDSDFDVMLQLPKDFQKTDKNIKEFTRMLYFTLQLTNLTIAEREKKGGKIFTWINPTTFHTYVPITSMWISSWHTVCKKNSDYTINEPWEECLKKLKNESMIYKRGYSRKSVQTDLHLTFPDHVFGNSKLTGNLRIADKSSFHYLPYHFIETLHWWYDKERMLRNPWDCEWRYPLFYPPNEKKPAT